MQRFCKFDCQLALYVIGKPLAPNAPVSADVSCSTASNSAPGFPTFSASEGGRYVPDPQQLPPSKSTDTDEESVEEVD